MSIRCNEVAAALATGGPIGRWRARRHAARCPHCASVDDELRRIADSLADVPPLTAAERRLWVVAAGDEFVASPSRAWWLRPALAGALAVLILGTVRAWWASHHVGPPTVAKVAPPAAAEETRPDVERLRLGVVALGQELEDLRRRADLLDARKDVDALMARLAPREGSSGL